MQALVWGIDMRFAGFLLLWIGCSSPSESFEASSKAYAQGDPMDANVASVESPVQSDAQDGCLEPVHPNPVVKRIQKKVLTASTSTVVVSDVLKLDSDLTAVKQALEYQHIKALKEHGKKAGWVKGPPKKPAELPIYQEWLEVQKVQLPAKPPKL